MVPWMRERGISYENLKLQRSSSLGYPGTVDVSSLRAELRELSHVIAVWQIHYNRTGDETVAKYYRQAQEKYSALGEDMLLPFTYTCRRTRHNSTERIVYDDCALMTAAVTRGDWESYQIGA